MVAASRLPFGAECCQLALVAHTPISSQSCEISGLLSRLYVGWRLWRNPYLWMALCKTLAMHDPAILNSAFVSVRQRCDNKSFVCVASKGMSTFVASMFWLLKRFHLTVLHIPGKKTGLGRCPEPAWAPVPQAFAFLGSRLEFKSAGVAGSWATSPRLNGTGDLGDGYGWALARSPS